MTDRYKPMTLAEGAKMAEIMEAADAASRMGQCGHKDACLRLMDVLCFGERGYGYGNGAKSEREQQNAARWMGCGECDEWEEWEDA